MRMLEVDEEQLDKTPIKIEAFVEKEFSFAEYHTDILKKIYNNNYVTEYSLIKGINIENHTGKEIQNLVLSFHFSNDAFTMDDIIIPLIDVDVKVGVRKIQFLKVDKNIIENLSFEDICYLDISLKDESSNKVLATASYSFIVLPIAQPTVKIYDDYRLFAKYINPLFPCVKQVTLSAKEKYHDNIPLIAYQNENDKNAMLREIQSIYLAIHDLNLSYQNPPMSSQKAQRIRLQDEVCLTKKGTCLDLALFYCAALEEVGYHPLLIIIDGHAFVGAFLEENDFFENGIENRLGIVANMVGSNINRIILIEATFLSNSYGRSFNSACEAGTSHLHVYEGARFLAVDVRTCHQTCFSPIPISFGEEELQNLIHPKEVEDEEIDPLMDRAYKNVLREEPRDRFTYWQNKLLDLTERNPLVSTSIKNNNTIRVISSKSLSSLAVSLIKNKDSISFRIFDFDETRIDSSCFLKEDLTYQNLGLTMCLDDLALLGHEKTLRKLIQKSKTAMEETGAPTLYLCLGMLSFINKKKKRAHAPFMVLPITIEKGKMNSLYTMKYDYDNIMINRTFFEYYKLEHEDVDFSRLYHISPEDNYLDAVSTFKRNCAEDIQLDENFFFITNLTFSHYVMWLDMKTRKEELRKNKIIASILANQSILEKEKNDENGASEEKYNDFAAPLPYDSTQLKAILDCGKGKSFILDGPPGTGKSQTIVNMIINAFYHGKMVLFVAEKKAALDVVAERLKKCGLDKFCLELHSNKSNKINFFEKLHIAIDTFPSKTPDEYQATCEQLSQERNELSNTMNRMHQKNKCFLSLYEAIVLFKEYEEYGKMSISLDRDYIASYTLDKDRMIKEKIGQFMHIAKDMHAFDISPLKVIGSSTLSFNDKELFCSDFSQLLNSFELVIDSATSVFDILEENGLSVELNQKAINTIDQIFEIIFNHDYYGTLFTEYILNSKIENCESVFDKAIEMKKIEDNEEYRMDINKLLDINTEIYLEDLFKSKGLKKFIKELKYKKLLRPYMKANYKLKRKDILSILTTIKEYKDLRKFVSDNQETIYRLTNLNILENLKKSEEIKEKYLNTAKLVKLFLSMPTTYKPQDLIVAFSSIILDKNKLVSIRFSYDEMRKRLLAYKELENKVNKKYKFRIDLLDQEYSKLDAFRDLLVFLRDDGNYAEVLRMVQINQLVLYFKNEGLGSLLYPILTGSISYRNMLNVYMVSLAKHFIAFYFEDENIENFSSSVFEKKIKDYADLIQKYNNLTIGEVVARISKNISILPDFDYAKTSPIGQLKKAIANHGRGLSIRQTLLKFDDYIKQLFPCFLMSPLSVAQYLAVDEDEDKAVSKFDIVIFDEASQIPTHESIGSIARGNSLIVAGDPEQMPPSSYFSAGIEVPLEEAAEMEDSPSLLDECLSISLPRHRLCFHYRSKFESLISFSNQNFYENKLITFPSPYLSVSSLEYKYINVPSMKKTSEITKEEIQVIYQTILEIYNDPNNHNKSLGIIVFNINQKEAVENFINEKLANDSKLSQILSKVEETTNEPLFIKSLENVQGDERDIIILSIGFGKNSLGYPFINGPLVKENGQRRLNVAVTRSKEKMIVLSTLHYYDFESDNKMRSKGKGRYLLKKFLEYVERASSVPSITHNINASSIAYFLKRDLEKDGMEVETNVGGSIFKVDLAIHGKDSNSYALGILIDHSPLDEQITCRDKFYVEPFMLSRLKWNFIHIYTLDYFLDKKKVIARIQKAMDYPVDGFIEPKIEPQIEQMSSEDFGPVYQYTEYRKAPKYDIYVKYDGYSFGRELRSTIERIIEKESPVSYETLKDRVKEAANMTKMSSKAQSLLDRELSYYFTSYRTKDQNQYVYWAKHNSELTTFRVGGDRDIYSIPKEEITCAMKQVILVQGELETEDLFRETLIALQYGTGVLNKKNRDRLIYVYKWAISENKIEKKG